MLPDKIPVCEKLYNIFNYLYSKETSLRLILLLISPFSVRASDPEVVVLVNLILVGGVDGEGCRKLVIAQAF